MTTSRKLTVPLTILAAIAVAFALHELQSTVLPFVVALFLSNIFRPAVVWLRKRKVPMVVAILFVLIIVGGGLLGLIAIATSSVDSLGLALPRYGARWNTQILPWLKELLEHAPPEMQAQLNNLNWSNIVQSTSIVAMITTSAGGFLNLLSGLALILLFMLFILAGAGDFERKIAAAYAPEQSAQLGIILQKVDQGVQRYLMMVTAVNVVSGISMSIILAAFGVDLALLWGVLAFLLSYIPTIGSLLALVLPIAVAFLQFQSVTIPLMVAVSLIVTQVLLLSVISPKLMGRGLNISPILILVSLIFWGWVWGGWGMILSVPITATIKIFMENFPATRALAVFMSADPGKPRGSELGSSR